MIVLSQGKGIRKMNFKCEAVNRDDEKITKSRLKPSGVTIRVTRTTSSLEFSATVRSPHTQESNASAVGTPTGSSRNEKNCRRN